MENKKRLSTLAIGFFAFLSSFLIYSHVAHAGSAALTWNANSEPDLAGYKVYYGASARTGNDPNICTLCGYSASIDVGNVTSHTINGLTEGGTYYFSVSAYDTSNNESEFSAEVSKTINGSNVFRFWSPNRRGHFFTINTTERDNIIATYSPSDWTYEGVAYDSYEGSGANRVPIYRFWSSQNSHHFYTSSETEKDAAIANYSDAEWLFEGIAYYVYQSEQPGTIPVYRFWSNQNRVHFYTSNGTEADNIINNYTDEEWRLEGVSWHVPQ